MRQKGLLWIKKIVISFVVVFVVTTITFFLMHTVKGDPFLSSIENVSPDARKIFIEKYGLDKPILEQYFIYLRRLILYGDLGVSLINRTASVSDILKNTIGCSLILGLTSVTLGFLFGCIIGAISAYSKNRYVKGLLSFGCILGVSLPVYVWAPMLQNFFCCKLHFLPVSGYGTISHIILPVICMMPSTMVTSMKYFRNNIEKIRKSDYYIAIRQRGFSEAYVFRKHILKNAMPSMITILVSNLSGVFTGAFVVEKIFSIPGIGRQFMVAITMRDYSILIGLNIVFTIIYVLFRLLGDFAQKVCNPRFEEG